MDNLEINLSVKSLEYIAKAQLKHGIRYNYSKVNYINAIIKIIIICEIHGQFTQTPNTHLNGSGCKKCGIIKCAEARRKTP